MAMELTEYYELLLSFTIFTSTIKATKLISFHKAFMQIAATIRLCFIGLASFAVEFGIVFMAFSSFFFYMLRTHLENFRDIGRTVMNVIAMSIGKFNFGAIKDSEWTSQSQDSTKELANRQR